MDETKKHYAQWKKPETKDYMLYDSIYMRFPEKAKQKGFMAENSGFLRLGWEPRLCVHGMGTRFLLGVMKML